MTDFGAWLLDLDGTLYDARRVKLAMAMEVALLGFGAVRVLRHFRQEHERVRREAVIAAASPYALQIQRTAEALGKPPDEVERIVDRWMIERPLRWLPSARRQPLLDAVDRFRKGGGRTGLVSDYPARRKLHALGAELLFDVVVANGEPDGPGRLKPWPDGYLKAAEALGVAPARCLVIGDRDDTDGVAAQAAGMKYRGIA
jgi:HAD superfamily hydrolase (TIGR01509 family)